MEGWDSHQIRSQDCPVSDSFDQSRVNPSGNRNRLAVLTPSCPRWTLRACQDSRV